MKFVTFNIRCDFGQDGANNFMRVCSVFIRRKRIESSALSSKYKG